jgi:HPt (histidine-containing phosphotransfer) domain-containing protein
MVDVFLDDCPRLIATMRTAAARNDARGLGAAAHTPRGASANYAATRLADAAAKVEPLAEIGELSNHLEHINALAAELSAAGEALRAHFSRRTQHNQR